MKLTCSACLEPKAPLPTVDVDYVRTMTHYYGGPRGGCFGTHTADAQQQLSEREVSIEPRSLSDE